MENNQITPSQIAQAVSNNSNTDSIWPTETEADASRAVIPTIPQAVARAIRDSEEYHQAIEAERNSRPQELQYVAGFLFSEDSAHVVLIEKNKPDWQKGKMNGVGGKIEEGETPEQAMRREFFEEAGLDVPSWQLFCKLNWRGGCVHFFRAIGDVNRAYTVTDEVIRRIPLEHLAIFKIIPNLLWLIPMAMDKNAGKATLEYLS